MNLRAHSWLEPFTHASPGELFGHPKLPETEGYSSASGSLGRCVTTFAAFGAPRLSQHIAVVAAGRRYALRGPLSVSLEYLEDGTVFATHAQLPVHGYGKSFGEALDSFCAMFDSQYRDLVEAPVELLTEHARDEREKLQRIVAAVETPAR